ncbi:hypothetical protein PC114_g25292 [Phytophthora cactorum]|nr:hypothetical protein PC114_g25292 [Phytophthora cactorum]
MDDDDAMGNQLTPRNKLDGLLLASDEEEVDDLLGFANFEWDEIQFDGASRVEEVVQEDSTEEGVQEDPDGDVQDGAEEAVQGREGVKDCSICLSRLEGQLWVCSRDTCRQPYHRECIMQAVAIDPRCGNCREPISLDVDDDEVLIVGHVAAPPKCNICDRVITGIVLKGPQCSHNVHPNCLVHDDDNNSAINDDNAFDYEEPERASPTRNVAASDDNSADEYHPSNFKSPSDSDEYEPSDE